MQLVSNAVLSENAGAYYDGECTAEGHKILGAYPFWVGTTEYLKDGVRYVRSVSYDEDAGQIVYSTAEKETGEIIECFVFDSFTGEPLSSGSASSG